MSFTLTHLKPIKEGLGLTWRGSGIHEPSTNTHPWRAHQNSARIEGQLKAHCPVLHLCREGYASHHPLHPHSRREAPRPSSPPLPYPCSPLFLPDLSYPAHVAFHLPTLPGPTTSSTTSTNGTTNLSDSITNNKYNENQNPTISLNNTSYNNNNNNNNNYNNSINSINNSSFNASGSSQGPYNRIQPGVRFPSQTAPARLGMWDDEDDDNILKVLLSACQKIRKKGREKERKRERKKPPIIITHSLNHEISARMSRLQSKSSYTYLNIWGTKADQQTTTDEFPFKSRTANIENLSTPWHRKRPLDAYWCLLMLLSGLTQTQHCI